MSKISHRTIVLLALLLGLSSYYYLQKSSRESATLGGTELIPAQKIGDFELSDVFGRSFRRSDLLGKWTVVAFGFTRCPDVCPVTLATFRDELNALPLNSRNRIQFVFIDVDPEFDTPERLKSYVQTFHTAIRPVTGRLADLEHFARQLHARFGKTESGEADLKTLSQSPQYFVINPDGDWQIIYSAPLVKGRLATDLKNLSRPKRFGVF